MTHPATSCIILLPDLQNMFGWKRWHQQFKFAHKSVMLTFMPMFLILLSKNQIFPHIAWMFLPKSITFKSICIKDLYGSTDNAFIATHAKLLFSPILQRQCVRISGWGVFDPEAEPVRLQAPHRDQQRHQRPGANVHTLLLCPNAAVKWTRVFVTGKFFRACLIFESKQRGPSVY